MKKQLLTLSILISFLFLCAWGSVGHKIINKKAPESFPSTMQSFLYWTSILEAHASDADNRKGSDPNESPRHFIDIDNYPEFVQNGYINQSYEYNVNLHGYTFVIDEGILPWAIIRTIDSLKLAFLQRNWSKASLMASDLGHYVGDGHMPLHITRNYNGQYTNQSGVHSRYESTMIGRISSQILYTNDTAVYIQDKSNYVFNFLYENYQYVDSVLAADAKAKLVTGSTSSGAFYDSLWKYTGPFTIMLFKNSSKRLADLIYTAWVDAGSPDPNVTAAGNEFISPLSYYLFQNYPNPFNPSTKIRYQVPIRSAITIKVYDMLGKEVKTLFSGEVSEGIHDIIFDASSLSSGVYLYELKSPYFTQTRKLLLLR